MKGKKGFSFAQVVLLAVMFALIFAWCAGAQSAEPPTKQEQAKPPAVQAASPAKAPEFAQPRAWDPAFAKQYDKFMALLDEVRKLSAAAEYLQERVNTLQRELSAQIPPGTTVDERLRMFVPLAVSPTPAAANPAPPVHPEAQRGMPTPTMVVPVPPVNEKPKPAPPAKAPPTKKP